jgi:hypothetical protein
LKSVFFLFTNLGVSGTPTHICYNLIVKNKKHLLKTIGSVIGVAILLVAFSFFSLWLVKKIRAGLEDLMKEKFISQVSLEDDYDIGVKIDPGESDFKEAGLVSAFFTDLFSGTGWVNKEKTTAYQDKIVTAFTFPPKFEWRRVSELDVSDEEMMRIGVRQSDGSDLRCIGSECLVQKDEKLYFTPKSFLASYNNSRYEIELPLEERNVVSVSIGSLETKWLVGVVEQKGGEYIGRVYVFENGDFEGLFENGDIFRSRYKGQIGFGGDDDNFLVIYGAYEGQAYHVKENNRKIDISRFFGIRVMDNGFEPVVIKQGDGKDAIWYIGSNTSGVPKLLKLFQNGTNDIVGAVDLTNSLISSEAWRVNFYPFGNNRLRAEVVTIEGNSRFWEFVDQGFEKSEKREIVSVNINNYPAEVRYVSIEKMEISEAGADISFYVSNDGNNWVEISNNEEIKFADREGRRLFWRAEFEPEGSIEKSPFLGSLQFKYLVKFL